MDARCPDSLSWAELKYVSDMSVRLRLSVMFFLQFAVWGCYMVSLGQYLGNAGLGRYIQWFYAVAGFAALFMPALAGAYADRRVEAQRLNGLCHIVAAAFMLAVWGYGLSTDRPDFTVIFTLFTLSAAAFSPTVSLTNTVCFAAMRANALDSVRVFPAIRVWGTVGFVAMMWVVNSVWIDGGAAGVTLDPASPHAMSRMQYTVWQLFAASMAGFAAGLYSLTLPRVRPSRSAGSRLRGWRSLPVLGMLRLFADRQLAPLFILALFIGVALQINNGYVTPFLTHFRGDPAFATSFGAANATLLSSLAQISEALWVLPLGCFMARCGIKATLAASIAAWAVNFFCFALGDTGSGLWLIVAAMVAYGVAFDFYNVAGAIYVDDNAAPADRAAAQGLLVTVNRGIASGIGMLVAGWFVNSMCEWTAVGSQRYLTGNWAAVWTVFGLYVLAVLLFFLVKFPGRSRQGSGRSR